MTRAARVAPTPPDPDLNGANMAGAALGHAPNHPRVRATAAIAATASGDHSRFAMLADIAAAEPAVAHLPGFSAALASAPPQPPKPVKFAPPPSPYEITNPATDKPKGGWWRKLMV